MVLNNSLKMLTNTKQNNWDEHIDSVCFAYRTAKLDGLDISPFELVYKEVPSLPSDIVFGQLSQTDALFDILEQGVGFP